MLTKVSTSLDGVKAQAARSVRLHAARAESNATQRAAAAERVPAASAKAAPANENVDRVGQQVHGRCAGPGRDERVEETHEGLRPYAEDQHQDRGRKERREFEAREITEGGDTGALRAVEDALPEREQEVGGGEEAEAAHGGGPRREAEDAAEDEELTDEAVEPGQTERGEKGHAAQTGKDWHRGANPAEVGDAAKSAGAGFDDAEAAEERGGGQAVVEHLEQRAGDAPAVAGLSVRAYWRRRRRRARAGNS